MRNRRPLKALAFLGVVLVLVLMLLYSGLRVLESTVLYRPRDGGVAEGGKTIVRQDTAYFPRQDITVVLVLGIDRYGPVADSGSYNNRGAADLVMLLIFDETNEICSVLHLNRDTMVEMPVLGIGGREAGTGYGQLALAHTYGSGLEDSCENTRKTVSGLLGGISIDHYIAVNMDAVAIANDAVGGVAVYVTEDFSRVDDTIGQGMVTLKGEQAIHYVRTRKDVGDQQNLSRMERQRAYIEGFADSFREKQEKDPEFILKVYEDVAPYLVTDCTADTISSMIDRYGNYTAGDVVMPGGRSVMGEEYVEFYVDDQSLDSLILELFYAPKTEK